MRSACANREDNMKKLVNCKLKKNFGVFKKNRCHFQ